MFAARGIGVALAIFLIVYLAFSLLIVRFWKELDSWFKNSSASDSANFLFCLRVMPFLAACAVTVFITIPSFWLLEPRAGDEPVGTAPVTLAIVCAVGVAFGVVRAIVAQRNSERTIAEWLDGSCSLTSKKFEAGEIPVIQTGPHAPSMTVAGISSPKVLVSGAAVNVLSEAELRGALRHEMAHVRRFDNLKKLVFRALYFPGMAALEKAWSESAEMGADDFAVTELQDALDLASALIKLSRLAPVQFAGLTTGLLHSATALSVRIERLVSWDKRSHEAQRTRWMVVTAPLFVIAVLAGAGYSTILIDMHRLTEWLVR
jgi:beta-lactamase regulating signal transducer with metallopeptidase domain